MKKFINENKKSLLYFGCSLFILILIFVTIIFHKSIQETSKEKFSNTIVAMLEQLKSKDNNEEYIEVEFPDKDIISFNGKIKNSNGRKYDTFKKGKVIYYANDTYEFKVSSGEYCATKTLEDTEILIDLTGPCEDYELNKKDEN